jgi:nucleoside-diphosphate-sugar epimerase
MNVLLIGGTRFIGKHVAQLLALGEHAVMVYHRGQHEGDLPASVRHVHRAEAGIPILYFPPELLTPQPDVVIHMMAMGDADAQAAHTFFRGHTGRMVWVSSGDVYRAYGRFSGIEPGPLELGLLREDSPLRSVLYPYRTSGQPPDDLLNLYEKILVERVAHSDPALPGTILRLPKVYGLEENADLATVYGFRNHPEWRWTHGYVRNVAAAIVLAATHPAASGCIYNVGERDTPTIAERLAELPDSETRVSEKSNFNFAQNVAYDTTRIRDGLGYQDVVPEKDAMKATALAREE